MPENLQRAMAAEAEAARNARAKVLNDQSWLCAFILIMVIIVAMIIIVKNKVDCKVIAAEGEHKASRALRQAS